MNIPGAAAYDSQITMHTSATDTDISLSRELQKIIQTQHGHMVFWISVWTENVPVNGSGLIVRIISKTEKMFHTYKLKFHVQQLRPQHFHFAFRMQKIME